MQVMNFEVGRVLEKEELWQAPVYCFEDEDVDEAVDDSALEFTSLMREFDVSPLVA